MLYVGVDLHKKSITLCGVNRERNVLETRRLLCCEEPQIVKTFETFRAVHGAVQLTVEATASYEWFLNLVEPWVDRIVLAHPKKLRVIAESTRKSQVGSAVRTVFSFGSNLLVVNFLPSFYVTCR